MMILVGEIIVFVLLPLLSVGVLVLVAELVRWLSQVFYRDHRDW